LIRVASALPGLLEVTRLLQVDHNPLHGSLSYPNEIRNIPHPGTGISGDAQQHVRMIGQERPPRVLRLFHLPRFRHFYRRPCTIHEIYIAYSDSQAPEIPWPAA
jgi:hypothetical protein